MTMPEPVLNVLSFLFCRVGRFGWRVKFNVQELGLHSSLPSIGAGATWDVNAAHAPHVVVGLLDVGDPVGVGGSRLGVGVGGVAGAARRCFLAFLLALGIAAGLAAVALFSSCREEGIDRLLLRIDF